MNACVGHLYCSIRRCRLSVAHGAMMHQLILQILSKTIFLAIHAETGDIAGITATQSLLFQIPPPNIGEGIHHIAVVTCVRRLKIR